MRTAGSATKYAYASRIAIFVINFAVMAMLTRILPPREFGLVAMTTSTVGLLIAIREFGLSSATIQAAELSTAARDAVFWFNVILAVLTATIVFLIAPFVSQFYGEPRLVLLLHLAAAAFLVTGLGTQHNAVLRRDLDFKSIFFSEVGGLVAGSVVAITLALWYRDAIAIVVGLIVQASVTTLSNVVQGRWLPSLRTPLSQHIKHAAFGANVTAFTFLNYITNNIGAILLGYMRGASEMGYFNRAQNLYALPVSFLLNPYLQVQFPLLCQANGDREKTVAVYGSLLNLTSLFFLSMAVVLPWIAVGMTMIVLGSQWGETGRILAWFAPGIAALGLVGPFGQFMTSQGRVKELSRWGVFDLLIRGGGAAIGAVYGGAIGAAGGFSIATLLVASPIIIWLTQRSGVFTVKDYFAACAPGLAIAAITGLVTACAAVIVQTRGFSEQSAAALVLCIAVVAWAVAVVSVPKTRRLVLRIRR